MNSPTPTGWIESTLDRHCSKITDGSHLSPVKMDGGWPIATVENMRSRHIDVPSCRRISKFDFDSLIRNSCSPEIGDVLFSKDGTIGKTFVFKQKDEIVLLSSIAIIRTEESQLVPDFLTQYLKSPFFFRAIENATSGSAIKRVVLKDIKSLPLKLPPLPEQQKIASILTAVDDVIESTQAKINKLKDLKTGMMQELLTKGIGHTEFKDSPVGRIPKAWEVIAIKEICSAIIDCVNKTAPVVDYQTPYKMIRTTNVRNGRVDTDNVRYVTQDTYDQWIRRSPPLSGDVIFTREAPVGEVGILRNAKGIFLGQRTMMYRVDPERSDNLFLLYSLQSEYCKKQIEDFSGGSTVAHMRVPDCGEILIKVPSIAEQRKIAFVLTSIEQAIELKELKRNKQQEKKKALMQDLLTGKVRVTT